MALLFSAYKLANCSTICMKYFTLVFLAALGLDSQAVLKAYKNICTPLSLELAFFFGLLLDRGTALYKLECPCERGRSFLTVIIAF